MKTYKIDEIADFDNNLDLLNDVSFCENVANCMNLVNSIRLNIISEFSETKVESIYTCQRYLCRQ